MKWCRRWRRGRTNRNDISTSLRAGMHEGYDAIGRVDWTKASTAVEASPLLTRPHVPVGWIIEAADGFRLRRRMRRRGVHTD